MSRIAKTYSKEIAKKYQLLGWTLKHEIRIAPENELYEYVFEWEAGGIEAPYPAIGGIRTPEQIYFKLSCLELVVLTAAMFVSIDGPAPPRLVDLPPKDRATISRLQEQCYALRDIAWSQAGTEMVSAREEVIHARLQTSVSIQIEIREAQLLAYLLEICADEVDAQGDIIIVTGFQEYGAGSADFRELQKRFIGISEG